jgi:tRNA-modifying protein YgfZ
MAADHNDRMTAANALPPSPEGAIRLHDWGVIRALGDEAAKFLHGQLTQDIEHLQVGEARLAGFCSAKGRLMASFVVWRPQPAEVLLACSADLLPAVLKRLSMFVLRAKCKLSDASADLPLWGLAGRAAIAALGDAAPATVWGQASTGTGSVIRLPDALVDGLTVSRMLLAGAEPPDAPSLDTPAWQAYEVHSGVARIVAATTEQFVPQMVNLELVGGVNFQKGCYPGQEVVARSQYRGTLKRRSVVMTCAVALAPGSEVFHDADPDQPAGRVVLSGALPGSDPVALVEVKLAALEAGTLHAGSANGPFLTPGALPYAFPAEQA